MFGMFISCYQLFDFYLASLRRTLVLQQFYSTFYFTQSCKKNIRCADFAFETCDLLDLIYCFSFPAFKIFKNKCS